MTKLLNSIYLGASTPSDYGNFVGGVELLPYDYYLGSAVPSGGGADYIDVILSGVSPLTLEKAISLNYLKLFGGTEQRNLPSEYTQVEYLESSGTQYIDTGIIPNVTTRVVAKIAFPDAVGTVLSWGSRSSGAYNTSLDQFYCGRTTTSLWYYSATTQTSISSGISPNVFYDIDIANTNVTATATQSIYLFALNNLGTASTDSSSKIAKFKVYNNGVLVQNLIPARRNSDNVLGMYDTVTGNFLTNAGTGTFTAGADVVPSPDTPIDIVCNNGVLKVTQNLIDLNAVTDGYYYDPRGVYSASATSRLTNYIPIKAGQSVTVYFKSFSTGTLNVRINIFNSNKVWQSQEVLQLALGADGTKIITPTANGYIRISANYVAPAYVDWDTAKVVYGEYTVSTIDSAIGTIYTDGTVETVEIDTTGDTATAEMLLKLGTYQDVQSVIDGNVTRNVGIKVLDGTESWNLWSTLGYYCDFASDVAKTGTILSTVDTRWNFTSARRLLCYVSQSDFPDVSTWKKYLSDQYANGTPVIIVYPLATATTESVTGQPLTVQAGTNIVEITQASIDGLEMEAGYRQKV